MPPEPALEFFWSRSRRNYLALGCLIIVVAALQGLSRNVIRILADEEARRTPERWVTALFLPTVLIGFFGGSGLTILKAGRLRFDLMHVELPPVPVVPWSLVNGPSVAYDRVVRFGLAIDPPSASDLTKYSVLMFEVSEEPGTTTHRRYRLKLSNYPEPERVLAVFVEKLGREPERLTRIGFGGFGFGPQTKD